MKSSSFLAQIWIFSILFSGLIACLLTKSTSLQPLSKHHHINPALNSLTKRNQPNFLACFGAQYFLCVNCKCVNGQVQQCGSTDGGGLPEHPNSEKFCRSPEFGGCICDSKGIANQALAFQESWKQYWALPEGPQREAAKIRVEVVRGMMTLPPPSQYL